MFGAFFQANHKWKRTAQWKRFTFLTFPWFLFDIHLRHGKNGAINCKCHGRIHEVWNTQCYNG